MSLSLPETPCVPTDFPHGRLAVAVSGGVDSLACLLRCVRAGRDVVAVHALFHAAPEADSEAINGLNDNCRRLGVPFHLLDLRHAFAEAVIAPFARAYRQGLTPNPCALCNRTMKFGLLLKRCLALGCDTFITGHYAALSRSPRPAEVDRPLLLEAADKTKDQSYFLSLVSRESLTKIYFPLHATNKRETIREVASAGLDVPVSRESQEICFIPRQADHYRAFLASLWEAAGETLPGTGPIVLRSSKGETRLAAIHHGLWRYTEGQRQGLGIAWSQPLYVLGKDVPSNTLFVGPADEARLHGADVVDLNVMTDEPLPEQVFVRLRYHQRPMPARIEPLTAKTAGSATSPQGLRIRLDASMTLSAPGQVAAIYDQLGRILAGGIISHVF